MNLFKKSEPAPKTDHPIEMREKLDAPPCKISHVIDASDLNEAERELFFQAYPRHSTVAVRRHRNF